MSRSIDLGEVFSNRQEELSVRLARSRSLTHPTAAGDEGEFSWEQVLRDFLPSRYSVARGRFVIDAHGSVSEQQDIVIYDGLYAPAFLVLGEISYIPVESVYAVIEVKPTLTKENVEAAASKAASVRRLVKSPGDFGILGGDKPARHQEKPILAGIVCHESKWSPAFGDTFETVVAGLDEDSRLNLGCVADSGAFSALAEDVLRASADNALIAFCVALFDGLQKFGNATAVDVIAYGRELWSTGRDSPAEDLG